MHKQSVKQHSVILNEIIIKLHITWFSNYIYVDSTDKTLPHVFNSSMHTYDVITLVILV